MLKILEKYKKYVLVVGGSLLMIAFIMPSAVNQLKGDPGKRIVAYMGDEKIRAKEFAMAHRELTAINRIAPLLINNLGIKNNDDLHWFLLSNQAQKAGLVGAESDGQMFVTEDLPDVLAIEIAQARRIPDFYLRQPGVRQELLSQAQKAMPNLVNAARRESQLTEQELYQAMAKLRGTLRLEQSFRQAGRLSERRLQLTAKRLQEFVGVDTVVVPASRLIDSIAEPTEAQLEEHFAKYRDVNPGTGENGLGYRQPDRVKLAWLFIDNLAISDSIKIDAVEANKRWRKENPTKLPEEFAKDRAQIEQTMRSEKVGGIMSQIDKIWRAQVLAATRRLEASGPYKKLPDDWDTTRPSLESIARGIVEGVKAGMDVNIPLPAVVIKDSAWMTARDLQRIPGIGQSRVTIGNKSGSTLEVVFTARELLPSPTQAPPTGLPVQAGVPVADAYGVDASQNRYYVMVMDARKAAPAANLDEVRDQVVKGLKTLHAYDALLKDSVSYENTAKTDGIEAIQKMFELPPDTPADADITKVEVMPNVLVSREQVGGSDPRIQIDAFRDTAMNTGDRIDPLKPVADVPKDQRTFTVPLPATLSVAIGQIASVEPLTQEHYRLVGEQLVRLEQDREFEKAPVARPEDDPFSVASLRAQLNFRMVAGDLADKEEKPEESATVPTSTQTPVEKATK